MLEWNVVYFRCMINNYASMYILVQSIPIFIMYMFMGIVTRVDSIMVASSSSVGGLGTLQWGRPSHNKNLYYKLLNPTITIQ